MILIKNIQKKISLLIYQVKILIYLQIFKIIIFKIIKI